MKIQDIFKKYHVKLDRLDLELLMAHGLKKSREFALTHSEYELSSSQLSNLKSQIHRKPWLTCLTASTMAFLFSKIKSTKKLPTRQFFKL